MGRRALKIVAAALCGFIGTVGTVLLVDWPGSSECEGETCALELAAVLTWAIVSGLLVGAAVGFVAFVLWR